MFKRIVCCLLIIALALAIGNIGFIPTVDATDNKKEETKVFDTATKDDDFVDNRVMVVLSHEESLKFKSYSAKDFPEIACKSVKNLSTAAAEKVQAKLRGEIPEDLDVNAAFMYRNVKVDTFKTILSLELENPGKENVLKAVRALEKREDVYYVGPDYIIPLDISPELSASDVSRGPVLPEIEPDPEPSIPEDVGWGEEAIELDAFWQNLTGNTNIMVGVVDTGINASHPDLRGKVNTSLSCDFVNDGVSPTTDPHGHGTHVAGIIGGSRNNSFGIQGVCPNVTFVSLRVIYEETFLLYEIPYTTAAIVADAIDYAQSNNIHILNLSINTDCEMGQASLNIALANYSGLVVCAAGNRSCDCDVMPNYGSYPAMAEDHINDNIISVGAGTIQNTVASYSNYGLTTVDLFAPGTNIASCYPKSLCAYSGCTDSRHISYGYHYNSGTSMAAPFVTGVAALMLSLDNSLTSSEIKELIIDNVKEYSAFAGKCVSGGLLNARNIFSLHSFHGNNYIYYVPVSSVKHQKRCEKCSYMIMQPHALDENGRCVLCSYPD